MNHLTSIIRVKHNRENPYVMLNRAPILDKDMPLPVLGLWVKCMSRPDDWQFNLRELGKFCGINKETAAKYIDKLIELRYAVKIEYLKRNEKGQILGKAVNYIFLEFQASPEEISLLLEGKNETKPESESPKTAKPDILIKEEETKSSKEDIYKEEESRSETTRSSAEASELTLFFLQKIKERDPKFKKPNMKKWEYEMDKLLRLDKRSPEEIRDLIVWASTDNWWKANCLCPSKLRERFSDMSLQMQVVKEKENTRINKKYVQWAKENYPERTGGISVDYKFVSRLSSGKEVPFNIPHEKFKELFHPMIGVK